MCCLGAACPLPALLYVRAAAAASDASRMNALTGSPITSDSSKQEGGGLVKQPGYILVVPQGTGDVSLGQVRPGRHELLTFMANVGAAVRGQTQRLLTNMD